MSKRHKNKPAEKVTPPVKANRPSPTRSVMIRAAGVVLGLVMGLVVTEVGLRALDIRPERYAPPTWLGWDGTQFLQLV